MAVDRERRRGRKQVFDRNFVKLKTLLATRSSVSIYVSIGMELHVVLVAVDRHKITKITLGQSCSSMLATTLHNIQKSALFQNYLCISLSHE